MDPQLKAIFKKGSKTYFNSSLFFPKHVREDVFRLYGFVRVADDYVDSVPQDGEGFYRFCGLYRKALPTGEQTGNIPIDAFVELSRRKNFPPEWAEAFLHSMELDLKKNRYETLDETLEYIYGSAEVIGLFMARLMGLPESAYPAAQMLGRSMQFINFIRDIAEDQTLGRTYLPLAGSGLHGLSEAEAKASPAPFESFIRAQAELYERYQKEADAGFRWIPYRSRIPIRAASDMYLWTSRMIQADPWLVYRRKVKPSKFRIVRSILWNALRCLFI